MHIGSLILLPALAIGQSVITSRQIEISADTFKGDWMFVASKGTLVCTLYEGDTAPAITFRTTAGTYAVNALAEEHGTKPLGAMWLEEEIEPGLRVSRADTVALGNKLCAEATQKALKDQGCRSDIKCWSKRHELDARIACTQAVERNARYQSEWMDGLLTDPRFTPLSAGSRNGSVLWVGDQVKFQNGFGAWQRMLYVCDYDPSVGKAIDVVVKPRNE